MADQFGGSRDAGPRSVLESPFVKGGVVVAAAIALFFAFQAYDVAPTPRHRHEGPRKPFRVIRQAAESELLASDRPAKGMALSIWLQLSSDFEDEYLLPDGSLPGSAIGETPFEVVDGKGKTYPVALGGLIIGGPIRLDIPRGYGTSPDGPVLRVVLKGVEKWRTDLDPFPQPVRVMPTVGRDDPRITAWIVKGVSSDGANYPTLEIQVDGKFEADEDVQTDLLKTSYLDLTEASFWTTGAFLQTALRVADVAKPSPSSMGPGPEAGGSSGSGVGQAVPTPVVKPGTARLLRVPPAYADAIREARVRVKVAKRQRYREVVEVRGVSIKVAFGQTVAMVDTPIKAPVAIPIQGYPPQRQPRKPNARIEILTPYFGGFDYLGPAPEDYGLDAIVFAGKTILATHPHGPPRAGPLGPIKLRIWRSRLVHQEEFTADVPLHRQ